MSSPVRRSTRNVGVLACLVMAGAFGFAAGAWADSSHSQWFRVGEYGSGSGHRCVGVQAAVFSPPSAINAYGAVRFRKGDDCDASVGIPYTGYMGVAEYLERGNGDICAAETWTNAPARAMEIDVATGAGAGRCTGAWAQLRGAAVGRIYIPSTGQYVTGNYHNSPWVN